LPLAAFFMITGGCLFAVRMVQRRKTPVTQRDEFDDSEDEWFGSLTPALAAQLPESERGRTEFRRLLRGAGLYGPKLAVAIYALRFVLLFVPLVVAGALAIIESQHAVRIMICGAAAAAALSIAPRLWVFFRRRRRLAEIRLGLPDAMDMLAMCMDGGVGLSSSLEQVSKGLSSYPSLAAELLILKRQAEVSSLKRALKELAERVELPEVRGLCTLLSRSDRLGTALSGSLLEQSDHLRIQRRQRATLQANKTPVKLVLPLMFCFAPAALILLTGPAVIELKEMLAPASGRSIFNADEGLDTRGRGNILGTLENLDQSFDQ
jgi:tight adherence protein C